VAVLAALAYLPALAAAPGRMPSDSKLYLYLGPGRLLADATSTFDRRQFAGWVPHQHIAYLWPAGPWFWVFEQLHVPDWVAHRLWIGTLMIAAGLGVRWTARLLGLGQVAAVVAAILYQVSPYVLPYVSRTSVMLLPWAGVGWIVAFTIRATRRRTWGDPAAIALIVLTVGAVNATALAMIVPAPVLWLVHTTWQRALTWRQAVAVGLRVTALTIPVCAWWIVALVIQGRFGAEVLPYSESLADVSLTATAPEVWRSLGYWLFYVRDPYAATTTESLRYLTSAPAIAVSFAVPIACLAGLAFVRWQHRRLAALYVGAGAVLAVGVHPAWDRSPLMRLVAGSDESGLALALRSSTRALPVMNLGLALLGGSLAAAVGRLPLRTATRRGLAGGLAGLAVVNMPGLWTGAFVDPALERDQDPPVAWKSAAEALDASGTDGRVLQLPGAEFGAFRWGYTVDQPLPGLTEKPLVTRDLLPLGSPGAMDLLYALDDRYQSGTAEPGALAPIARWLGVDTVWVANDLAYDRFRTARPEVVGAAVAASPGFGEVEHHGEIGVNKPAVAMIDERALGDPSALVPVHPVDLYPVIEPGRVIRAGVETAVVSGSGDGLVDLAGAGVLDGREVVQYTASLSGSALSDAIEQAGGLIVTDSNRSQARHWRSSQDTRGYTESDQPGLTLLRDVASDQRLPVFTGRDTPVDSDTQTLALQRGPVTATATSYGEPFAYLPEHRPFMAIDGDPATSWTVGEHGDPIGEVLRLRFDVGSNATATLVQAVAPGGRLITRVSINGTPVELGGESATPAGQVVNFPAGALEVDIRIDAVAGGEPGTAGAVAAVGFAEVIASDQADPAETGRAPTVEVARPPIDALESLPDDVPVTFVFTRLRSDPMNRWRSDPEPTLSRYVPVATRRTFQVAGEVRVDRRAADQELAALFGWPAWASSRLTGSVASAGVSAIDGDPSTAWITGFDQADGAVLTIDGVTSPVDRIAITQPAGGYSRITAVTLRSGGDERAVELVPDAIGTATAVVDPPLPPGRIEVELSGVEIATTVDRRYGDTVQRPAAISELTLPGLPAAPSVVDSSARVECPSPVEPLAFAFDVDGASAIDGSAIHAEPCAPEIEILPDARLTGTLQTPAVQLDRLVLSQPREPKVAPARPTATVVGDEPLRRMVTVSDCPDGCWLVLGEGYNPAWAARGPNGSLGRPQLVDGGFNGWWLTGSAGAIPVELTWTQQSKQDLALLLTLAAAAIAVALVAVDRRRPATHADTITEPEFDDRESRLSIRSAATAGAAWCLLAGLLVSPIWVVAGAVAAGALVITRRAALAGLTALAVVAVVGALVTARAWRSAPAPNGGWPVAFESWHRLAMFAIVAVLVAAITADDAGATATGPQQDQDHPPQPPG
jgi:arabinofuranan 3-O-arabinosyltransferase